MTAYNHVHVRLHQDISIQRDTRAQTNHAFLLAMLFSVQKSRKLPISSHPQLAGADPELNYEGGRVHKSMQDAGTM